MKLSSLQVYPFPIILPSTKDMSTRISVMWGKMLSYIDTQLQIMRVEGDNHWNVLHVFLHFKQNTFLNLNLETCFRFIPARPLLALTNLFMMLFIITWFWLQHRLRMDSKMYWIYRKNTINAHHIGPTAANRPKEALHLFKPTPGNRPGQYQMLSVLGPQMLIDQGSTRCTPYKAHGC